jgi:predicted amidohydrolase YtcJ
MTLQAARQSGDESLKGSIEVGKQADLVVLSADPLSSDPENLRDLQVVETLARGRRVWPAP